jgi:hypothetical protein
MCPGGTIFPEGMAIGSTWNMDLVVEPGTFAVMVGSSSEDIRPKGEFVVK